MADAALFSIGYATKPIGTLIDQLRAAGVTAVADIRSVPYSNAFFDYHREALQKTLKQAGIRYVWLGEALGPRSRNDAHYDAAGQVQFDRLARSTLYRGGIERVMQGLEQGFHIALLCAEKKPEVCHRSLLVGCHLLRDDDVDIVHITHDGERRTQRELELSLASEREGDLFATEADRIELAMKAQWQLFAWRRS